MATIAPSPPTQRPSTGGGRRTPVDHGRGEGGSGGGGVPLTDRYYYTGMALGLAAIGMLFAGFTSAYFVRKGISDDWSSIQLPPILWGNTLVLLCSSVTLERARRRFPDWRGFGRWWGLTCGLGVLFLIGQVAAWRELASQGVYLNTNPSSSFFYLLTASHAVHLGGGLVALLWVWWRGVARRLSRTAVGVTAWYWHFMDGLWVYLLVLLTIWR